ncbi:hypothetical protein MRB53_020370 [Persea americana]|uniref:Uncharacterized protein n=1 Tax=Persea americana TaxID=3435 RepID=A0ACC2L133_PERAE|nr:hypothetical protein MRB53_020370 [Persea americana]
MKMDRVVEYGGGEELLHGVRRKKMKNKRRFSEEQIRSLESKFEEETKLEPQKKVELARDLGLQPRQVAIWFQNRRARWKSKQLEKEYSALRADYGSLASSFESLKEEKQCLLEQLRKLGDLLEKHPKENSCCGSGPNRNSSDHHSDKREIKTEEYEQKGMVDRGSDVTVIVYTDGGNGKNNDGFRPKEAGTQSMEETGNGSMTLPDWSGFDPEYYSDQSCSSLQWWDLWQ